MSHGTLHFNIFDMASCVNTNAKDLELICDLFKKIVNGGDVHDQFKDMIENNRSFLSQPIGFNTLRLRTCGNDFGMCPCAKRLEFLEDLMNI